MGKVLVFGTFDVLHDGHLAFLKEAKTYGDTLHVVVARNKTVEKIKGQTPLFDEERRKANLRRLEIVDQILLGSIDDNKVAIVHEVDPQVVCLGYDQELFVDQLLTEEQTTDLDFKVIRLKACRPQECKSSAFVDQYVKGCVVRGKGEGHRLGYPTANIAYEKRSETLASGVFATTVWHGSDIHSGVAIVGVRDEEAGPLLEVHILNNFNDDLYGQELIVRFEYKVRDVERYTTDDALLAQIQKDVAQVKSTIAAQWTHLHACA